MPTLSYCQFVNNCSPNLLLFKVDRYGKLYFDPFFTCRAFWPCPTQLLIYISQCPSCPALLLPTLWSTFALPLLICPSAMTCPALYYPALCPVRSCPANSTISGRSDRKVLRLIYIYIKDLARAPEIVPSIFYFFQFFLFFRFFWFFRFFLPGLY